jgi:hypothetical protein
MLLHKQSPRKMQMCAIWDGCVELAVATFTTPVNKRYNLYIHCDALAQLTGTSA